MATTQTNTAINPAPAKASNPAGNAGNPAEDVRQQGAGTDAQMPTTPSQIDNLRSMMAQRHPDSKYENDDDFYAAIADDYANNDKQLGEYRDREKRISDLFSRDARSAKFLNDWMDGSDPVVELMRKYGDDFKAALEDPDKVEELAKANEEWVKALAEEKRLTEEYEKNLDETYAAIEKLENEQGMDPDKVDEALEYLRVSAAQIIMGKFTPELIQAALKAINYDSDIANAEHEAEVRGRNSRAEMQLRKPQQTDGMPQLGSRSGGTAPKRPQIQGALGREKQSIWEKGGGIKRTQR